MREDTELGNQRQKHKESDQSKSGVRDLKKRRKRKGSIKWKLLRIIIPVVGAMVAFMVLFSFQMSRNIIEGASRDMLESSVENQAAQIEAWLNENLVAFQAVKTGIEKTQMEGEKLQALLDAYCGYNSNYPEGLYIADEHGGLQKASQSSFEADNPMEAVWYKEGLTRWNMNFTAPYEKSDGSKAISASGLLDDGSGVLKVISADLSLDTVSVIVNSFVRMEGAEAFLADAAHGTILAHRDTELLSTKLSESKDDFLKGIGECVSKQSYGFLELQERMAVMQEIDGTDWVLVSYIPQQVVLKDLYTLRNRMIAAAALSILLLSILIERVAHRVVRPVKKLTGMITAMSGGDFTVAVKTRGNDEIAVMSRSVEQFTASMRAMIADIRSISKTLEGQAENSDQVSHNMFHAAKTQSQSMGELNQTVDQLAISVNEIAKSAGALAAVVSDTQDNSRMADQKMQETVETSNRGKQDMEQVSMAMDAIAGSIRDLDTAVNKVGEATREINAIAGLIGDIADETNLLSINASIEAARAGEMGRGFAVVADQIGKLAKSSAESVGHISGLIGDITGLVDSAVEQAGSSSENIDKSSRQIQQAIDAFDAIFRNIHETNAAIQSMIEKVGEVDRVASSVAAVSQEQAASSDEILAASETMVAQANEITKNSQVVAEDSQNLAESSKRLSQQMETFQI